jgi:hypothetical protein
MPRYAPKRVPPVANWKAGTFNTVFARSQCGSSFEETFYWESLTAIRLAGRKIDPSTAINFISSLSRCAARAILDWTRRSRCSTRL